MLGSLRPTPAPEMESLTNIDAYPEVIRVKQELGELERQLHESGRTANVTLKDRVASILSGSDAEPPPNPRPDLGEHRQALRAAICEKKGELSTARVHAEKALVAAHRAEYDALRARERAILAELTPVQRAIEEFIEHWRNRGVDRSRWFVR